MLRSDNGKAAGDPTRLALSLLPSNVYDLRYPLNPSTR